MSNASKKGHRCASCAGFTLIEVIVVIAITAMLSSFLILYNSNSRQRIALFVEQAKIAQTLQRAKSISLSKYAVPGDSSCGYGVRFDYTAQPQTYFVFQYALGAGEDCSQVSFIQDDDNHIQPVPGLAFEVNSNVVFDQDPHDDRIEYVLFIPPNPRVLVTTGDITHKSGKVYLKIKSGDEQAVIGVGSAGQINI